MEKRIKHLQLHHQKKITNNNVHYCIEIWGKNSNYHVQPAIKKNILLQDSKLFRKHRFANIDNNKIAFLNQKHSNKTVYISNLREQEDYFWSNADAAFTDQPNTPVMIRTADCVPILFWNVRFNFCGAIHCGWKGAQNQIIFNTIKSLKDYSNNFLLSDYQFLIGPHISEFSYEVGQEFLQYFDKSHFLEHESKQKVYLNLTSIVTSQLTELGIQKGQISSIDEDTLSLRKYFSHRGKDLYRNISLIYLN